MKKILKNKMLLPALCLTATILFGACSDWTQTERLTITEPSIEDVNPELYAQYLAALSVYKQSDHKVVYVTFDNSNKIPGSRGEHINIVPDSVDIISVSSPDNLTQIEIEDMAAARTKSTKIVYTISYEQIEAMYVPVTPEPEPESAAEETEETEPTPEVSDFDKFLASQLDKALQLCDKYGYDGITISYMGRSTQTMTDAQKAAYASSQSIVTGLVSEWAASHKSKMLIFEGYPKNLLKFDMLDRCSYLIIPTQDMKSTAGMHQRILQALPDGVPDDNIIVGVVPFSLDPEDVETGYFADGTSAMHSTAYWIATDGTRFTKAGLAIYDVQTDYYYRPSVYRYTRGAIDIMNPTAKN